MYEDSRDDELPLAEVQVRRIHRSADDIHRRVLAWADRVLDLLPKGLQLTEDEAQLLRLFLAQQRRLNLELDRSDGNEGLLSWIAKLPFLQPQDRDVLILAAHKLAFSYLEQAIEDIADRVSGRHGFSPSEPALIDWRVAVRYMAQQLHRIGRQLKLRGDGSLTSPLRFELILTARDLATEVVAKRTQLLDSHLETATSSRSLA